MDRRTFVFTAGLVAAGLAPAVPSRAGPMARIALVLPLTGERAAEGAMACNAALLAIDQVDRDRRTGRPPISVQVLDCGSSPKGFITTIRRLPGEEKFISMFGLCPPAERDDLLAFLSLQGGLFWDAGPAEAGGCSPHMMHVGPTPHHSLGTLLPFMTAEVGRRFIVVGDAGGRRAALLAAASAMLNKSGATRVGGVALVDNTFDELLRRIRCERVDVVLSVLEGAQQIALLKAYRDAHLDPHEIPIASPTLTEADMVAAGPGVAAGHIAVQPYFTTWRSPENAVFLNQWRRRYGTGVLPAALAEAAWCQIQLFAKALDALGPGELHPITVREAARDRSVAAPQGRVRLDGTTLHAELWPKVAVVEPSGKAKILARTAQAVAPLPACRSTGH